MRHDGKYKSVSILFLGIVLTWLHVFRFNWDTRTTTVRSKSLIVSTSTSHEERKKKKYNTNTKSVSISFEMVPKLAVNYDDARNYRCPVGQKIRHFYGVELQRDPLGSALQQWSNFSTTLALENVRILVMGDSLAMQYFQMLDMAVGGSKDNRTVLYWVETKPEHFTYALSSTGTVGAWRITDVFHRDNQGKPLPNSYGGGWNASYAQAMLNLPDPRNKNSTIQQFDVIIFQVTSAWFWLLHRDLSTFNVSCILDSLQLANEVFGVKKVILLTMPVLEMYNHSEISILLEKNRELKLLVNNFVPGFTIPGITDMLIMDVAELMFSFFRANARSLGYINETNSSSEMDVLQTRIDEFFDSAPAAMVCARPMVVQEALVARPSNRPKALRNVTNCVRNSFFADHCHVCANTFGGRIVATTACLLQCMHRQGLNDNDVSIDIDDFQIAKETQLSRIKCQEKCTSRFMKF